MLKVTLITTTFAIAVFSTFLANAQTNNNPLSPIFVKELKLQNFYKGNLHNHIWVDHDHQGQRPLEKDVETVSNWYKQNKYHFLAITDHIYASVPGDFSHLEDDNFIFLHGEEADFNAHMLALCGDGTTLGMTNKNLAESVEIIREIGATPILAHAHYSGITADEITGIPIMEIYNAGTGTSEAIWTELLDRGELVYGVAVDDNHGIKVAKETGVAWVQVSANDLKAESICTALEKGHFYASTGVNLTRISTRANRMYIVITPQASDQPSDYVTEFIGINNQTLKKVIGYYPSFSLSVGNAGYIRAKVTGPTGTAWIQPVKIKQN